VAHCTQLQRGVRLPIGFFCCAVIAGSAAQGQTFHSSADLDAVINQAVREDKIPGAVVIVGHNGEVVYRKAYGNRALVPAKEPMTVDTIFDIASLTKIVGTTSAIMKLVEQGKVHIDDPVTNYLPEFQGGKSAITVRDLMTHYSGLRPDLELDPAWSGYETGIRRALADKPAGPPEASFVYSDINFILTGEIVHRVSGLPENDYVKQILFNPLGMADTGYLPAPSLRPRIAPTEMQKDGTILRGVVHDPTARDMGGVAGHAGIFSTADDLAKFCQMILDGGDGLFSPATIAKFTSPASPPNLKAVRGLGWDIDSPYSGPRGDLFPVGSFGHTGFTGTSMWIDPASRTYVILMSNSVHPAQRKAITPLRRSVATIAAASVSYDDRAAVATPQLTKTGLDVIEQDGFKIFRGKKIGLITNQTGVDSSGRRNVDVMKEAGIDVVALFAPEHGIFGAEDRENLTDSVDAKTGIKVWSLYGKTRRPTPEMLRGLDALVFDIQDAGVRFYTYESSMLYAMEEAAKAKLPFFVLDRPNPITGVHVEGPMLDVDKLSFTGAYRLPLRHGMTLGELARLMNENPLDRTAPRADLRVVAMAGWRRDEWFDATGLPWVNPSPNIRNLDEAVLYPAIGIIEHSTNYSVGRGTDAPFEQIGATWIRGRDLAMHLNLLNIPGVRFYPVEFTPSSSNFSGKPIEGVRILLTNRDLFSATRLGLALASTLEQLYPKKIVLEVNKDLIGNSGVMAALAGKGDAFPAARTGLQEFLALRQKYLIYQ
jgi:uncharacterized protein YbbC (DUF1343 family)/CubicO group peptidase (beta-lactamase class C family)